MRGRGGERQERRERGREGGREEREKAHKTCPLSVNNKFL